MIARETQGEVGTLLLHRFPDDETHVRLDTSVEGREAVFVCTFNQPDSSTRPSSRCAWSTSSI